MVRPAKPSRPLKKHGVLRLLLPGFLLAIPLMLVRLLWTETTGEAPTGTALSDLLLHYGEEDSPFRVEKVPKAANEAPRNDDEPPVKIAHAISLVTCQKSLASRSGRKPFRS